MKCAQCDTVNSEDSQFCKKCATSLTELGVAQHTFTRTLEAPVSALTRGILFADRYEIIEELGVGGMGAVYRVEDTQAKEEIALKLIKPEIAVDKKTIERFRNELTTARKIRHRNVCGMYDLNEEKGTHYITMEYVPGEDLKSFLRRSGRLTVSKAISIAKQVCEGLSEAHGVGIVHRDLKPSNIMIDKQGNVRIMDFGIARTIKAKGITGAGVMIGTPEYMSPEQAEAKEIDHRSDIYSLGVILYEMTTGGLPFEADSAVALGMKHKSEIPRNPMELNPQIPEDLNRVILMCLEKEEEIRYQSAFEVSSELGAIEQGLPTSEITAPQSKALTSREITVTFGLKKLLIPTLLLFVLIAGIVIIRQLISNDKIVPAPKIDNSIAVISFTNQTGDEGFDYLQDAIPNLLITSLEQAGSGYVMTWERMHDLLKQVGEEDVVAVDRDLGFKACLMEGVESIVIGSFVKAGDMFATDIKVLDVDTKKLLSSASSKGEGEGSIIRTQIDELSREISKTIGISSQKADKSLPLITEVTTSSMEAYNFYLKGRIAQGKNYWEEANKYFKKAVELDPTFASAYNFLANTYSWLGDSKARSESYMKAKEYLEKTSGKERLYLEASIAGFVDGDTEKYLQKLNQIAEEYPKEKFVPNALGWYYLRREEYDKSIAEYTRVLDLDPMSGLTLNQLGYAHAGKGEYAKAIEYFNRYVSVYPDDANPYDSLGEIYYRMGRISDAIGKYEEAIKVKPDFYSPYNRLGYIFALKGDLTSAMARINKGYEIAVSPGRKLESCFMGAFVQFWFGRYEEAFKKLQEAAAIAEELGSRGRRNFIDFIRGWIYLDKGDLELSRKHFKSWLESRIQTAPRNRSNLDSQYNIMLGLIDLKAGQTEAAKSKLETVKTLLPELELDPNSYVGFLYCVLYSEVAMLDNQPEEAIAIFEEMEQQEGYSLDTYPLINHNIPWSMREILARAYQQKGDADKAIAEYTRLTTFVPEGISRHLIHPRYHYRIAKLYEQNGWAAKATEHYEKFLDLWKDADPGLPEVADARERVARLKLN